MSRHKKTHSRKEKDKGKHGGARREIEGENDEYNGNTETPIVPECVLYADDTTINIGSGKQQDINERCKNYGRMAWLRKLNIQWKKTLLLKREKKPQVKEGKNDKKTMRRRTGNRTNNEKTRTETKARPRKQTLRERTEQKYRENMNSNKTGSDNRCNTPPTGKTTHIDLTVGPHMGYQESAEPTGKELVNWEAPEFIMHAALSPNGTDPEENETEQPGEGDQIALTQHLEKFWDDWELRPTQNDARANEKPNKPECQEAPKKNSDNRKEKEKNRKQTEKSRRLPKQTHKGHRRTIQ